MGCCIGKKVEPITKSGNDTKIQTSEVLKFSPRSRDHVKRENIHVHGRVNDTYRIYAAIGKGAFGHVVRAEHNLTKKPYAIKIIALSEEVEQEKKSEIEILRTVDHKYVIKLHDVISTPGKLYLVMDLATGGELFDRIYLLGKFDENDATRVLKMILDGIQYLHSVGITHRDLKPENILYYHPGNDSRIIITDFGLAAIRSPADIFMNTDCGTVEYMAPEVIMRRPYTNAVDMWSIGVITYILLSGKMPFPVKHNVCSLLRAICLGKYDYFGEPWNNISQEAKAFIDSLLIVEYEKRLTASQALEHKWIKEQHKKMNLQRSISSNWTESCLSLNSTKSRKHIKRKERVGSSSKTSNKAKLKDEMVYSEIGSSPVASTNSDVTKRRIPQIHRQKCYQTVNVEGETHGKKHGIHYVRTINDSAEEGTSSRRNLASKTKQQRFKVSETECSPLKKHAPFSDYTGQTAKEIGRLPPLKSSMAPVSTWNEAAQLR